ncbi:hypothetical protein SPBR_02372 [Sporothrix brasiliensis 5110]|uniref:C3H1-type domain-containing protein n=1 Tax=Sporothrix brasiliensis 5110 TaxID=1398154 RepID=A0A0C2J240_9PEZI|nr:uncharacterized protein SPBR_02372 [Sporothrix brasiliensis 5110]KIH93085.1 hypothetical protein SPBR_02372 [Sporothrix brasiliensis 5110]
MDADCGPRSSQLNLSLHYRHPHHAGSISAQRSHGLHGTHNPQPNARHRQQDCQEASRRQYLRAAPDEGRVARETLDGGAGRLTRAGTAPTANTINSINTITLSTNSINFIGPVNNKNLLLFLRLPTHPSPYLVVVVVVLARAHRITTFFRLSNSNATFPIPASIAPHIAAMDETTNCDVASKQPASPETPLTVPALSSSPGENAATSNALHNHKDRSPSPKAQVSSQHESPTSAPSPRSQAYATIDSSSDRDTVRDDIVPVNDSLPEPGAGPGQSTYQNVTAPFHFPMPRRNSVTDNASIAHPSPPKQAQTAQSAQTMQQAPSSADTATFGGYFAYCLDRGNGLYTRLIPADRLPPTAGFVALQNDSRGMFVLPDPSTHLSPSMALPSMPVVNTSVTYNYGTRPVQQRPGQVGSANAKKQKVYCDKWVHEGICAFTQQGCKFKHEMPHDRATQRSLGLFQGYPNWYKKLQAQEQHQHHQQHPHPHQPSMETPAMAPLALLVPPTPGHGLEATSVQSQPFPTGFPYPNIAPVCVPAPPPPTPTPLLHLAPAAYQPIFSNFGSPTSNRQKSGLNGNTATGIDGHWRANSIHAASWRTSPVAGTMANVTTAFSAAAATPAVTSTVTTDYLADNFARGLTMDGVASLTSSTSPTSMGGEPRTGTAAFSSFGYGANSSFGRGFGTLGGHLLPLGPLGESESGGGSSSRTFGPIGPPPTASNSSMPGVSSPAATATASFTYRSAGDESGHLATDW